MTIFPSAQTHIHINVDVDVDVDFINNLLNDMPCITIIVLLLMEFHELCLDGCCCYADIADFKLNRDLICRQLMNMICVDKIPCD